jgi:AcrR family transcriptional regulator
VPGPVKPRRYDNSRRQVAASRTRSAILAAARELIAERGYLATTVADVATRAGVAVDTIYAAVGTKPELFRLLIETALSGTDEVVPGEQRDYAARMRATDGAAAKLDIYAGAIAQIQPKLAPLHAALSAASGGVPELAELWHKISERRAVNMRRLAADLAETAELRDDLTLQEVADIIWSLNSSEYYTMLVTERGWTVERYAAWLADAWKRLLLKG